MIQPMAEMAITTPKRKNTLLKITVFDLPVAPNVLVYPATAPITAKLQAQVKTLKAPKRKTATKTITPVWPELIID